MADDAAVGREDANLAVAERVHVVGVVHRDAAQTLAERLERSGAADRPGGRVLAIEPARREREHHFAPPIGPTCRQSIWLMSRMMSRPFDNAIGPHTSSRGEQLRARQLLVLRRAGLDQPEHARTPSSAKNIPSARRNPPSSKVREAAASPETTGLCHTTLPSRPRQVNRPRVLLPTANRWFW